MRKLLFLGAAQFQTPPLRYAREAGYRIFTCDNRPTNPGHSFAEKSFNISTLDRGAVRKLAEELAVDGVVAFGSDVAATTAAYVTTHLGLPGASPETVECLTQKDRFREFLNRTGLQPWPHRAFTGLEGKSARAFAAEIGWPVMVKPTDASGSRGVALVKDASDFGRAFATALSHSHSGRVVVESFFQKHGYQICGDGYLEDGKLIFVAFGDGHFYDDGEFLAPYGETFPSSHSAASLNRLRAKLEAILIEAGYRRGPINIDCLVDEAGNPFVIEIGPRTGGNYLPSAIRYHCGVDLVAASVESASDAHYRLDLSVRHAPRFTACFMVHSRAAGILESVPIPPDIAPHLIEDNPYLAMGAEVSPFHQGSSAIGNWILRFDDAIKMVQTVRSLPNRCQPRVRSIHAAAV